MPRPSRAAGWDIGDCTIHIACFQLGFGHMTKENVEPFRSPPTGDAPATFALAMPRAIDRNRVATRREHDLLGEAEVPADAYWGIHTLRAVENFPITGVPIGHFPELIRALALVKQAAARANRRLKQLPTGKADAIDHACALIAKDRLYLDQFVVDAVQGGAGTSTNMNANEVVANLALEFLGQNTNFCIRLTTSTWPNRPMMPIRRHSVLQ